MYIFEVSRGLLDIFVALVTYSVEMMMEKYNFHA